MSVDFSQNAIGMIGRGTVRPSQTDGEHELPVMSLQVRYHNVC
jgi:hypothetical protein